MEFWNTLADEQAEREQKEQPSNSYLDAYWPDIVPLLLDALTKQHDDQTTDSWNMSVAAATCLGLLGRVAHDDIAALVFPWAKEHIGFTDWHHKDAALNAFGSVLEFVLPTVEDVVWGVDAAVALLHDPRLVIAETAAWTLGRLSEFCGAMVPEERVPGFVRAMLSGLQGPARVASNCCWAVANLEKTFRDAETMEPRTDNDAMRAMVPEMLDAFLAVTPHQATAHTHAFRPVGTRKVVVTLLALASRSTCEVARLPPELLNEVITCFDIQQGQQRFIGAAYVALGSLVEFVPYGTSLDAVFAEITKRLEETLLFQINTDEEAQNQASLQGTICEALQRMIYVSHSIKDADARIQSETATLMPTLIRVLEHADVRDTSSDTAAEEGVLVVIESLATRASAPAFEPYLPAVVTYLVRGLRNPAAASLCVCAAGMLGSLSRLFAGDLARFLGAPVEQILRNLESCDLGVRGSLLSALGDTALGAGDAFAPFVPALVAQVLAAGRGDYDAEGDDDLSESLQLSIFETLTGLLQTRSRYDEDGGRLSSRSESACSTALLPFLPDILEMLRHMCLGINDRPDAVSSACGLFVDLGSLARRDARFSISRDTAAWILPFLHAHRELTEAGLAIAAINEAVR